MSPGNAIYISVVDFATQSVKHANRRQPGAKGAARLVFVGPRLTDGGGKKD